MTLPGCPPRWSAGKSSRGSRDRIKSAQVIQFTPLAFSASTGTPTIAPGACTIESLRALDAILDEIGRSQPEFASRCGHLQVTLLKDHPRVNNPRQPIAERKSALLLRQGWWIIPAVRASRLEQISSLVVLSLTKMSSIFFHTVVEPISNLSTGARQHDWRV